MRQEHRAGEKMFVDYAGHTVAVVDPHTGEVREAQIFVAVLGASNYTFAEATWTQALPDWIASHVRAFEFYGGCAELVIYNHRPAVSRAHRYEPDTNPTYHAGGRQISRKWCREPAHPSVSTHERDPMGAASSVSKRYRPHGEGPTIGAADHALTLEPDWSRNAYSAR